MNHHTHIERAPVHPLEAAAQRIVRIGGITLLASAILALGAVHMLAWRGVIEITVLRIP